jgi:hypothetical protein
MNLLMGLLVIILSPAPDFMCEDKALRQNLSESDAVIIASVVSVTPPKLPIWSSALITTQLVKYKVTRVLKGHVGQSEIIVMHRLISGSRTANRAMAKPQLSPKLFKQGRSLLLMLRKKNIQTETEKGIEPRPYYVVIHETCGVLPSPSPLMRLIEKILNE